MNIDYFLQALISFLLALFTIVPELKANNSKDGESRRFRHTIIIFLKKPFVRITSLIVLFIGLSIITKKIQHDNNLASNKELDRRDSVRASYDHNLRKAITSELKTMGFKYDSIKKTLIHIQDSSKRVNQTREKPLLTTVITVDTSNRMNDKVRLELRSAGGNIKKLHILTSIAAIINGKASLMYKNDKVFANDQSIGKEIQKAYFDFVILNSQDVSGYLTHTNGYYLDMDNNKYDVDNYYLLTKHPFNSGVLPPNKLQDAKSYFLKGKELYLKY
jgi:hypothetical protein